MGFRAGLIAAQRIKNAFRDAGRCATAAMRAYQCRRDEQVSSIPSTQGAGRLQPAPAQAQQLLRAS